MFRLKYEIQLFESTELLDGKKYFMKSLDVDLSRF